MEQQILVYYFVREMTIHAISNLLNVTQHYVKVTINASLKPINKTDFIILESKMNTL